MTTVLPKLSQSACHCQSKSSKQANSTQLLFLY